MMAKFTNCEGFYCYLEIDFPPSPTWCFPIPPKHNYWSLGPGEIPETRQMTREFEFVEFKDGMAYYKEHD